MKCGECLQWYNDDGYLYGVCMFDQVERHQNCECKHPGYLNPEEHNDDPYVPAECAGCKHLPFRVPWPSMYPCHSCSRAYTKDYYEKWGDGRDGK